MTRRAMPSPRGTNAAGLFVTSERGFGLAYDAAPEPKQRMTKAEFDRAYDYAVANHGQKAADALWNGMVGPAYERDDQEKAEDDAEQNLDLMDPSSPAAKLAAREAVSKDSKARDGLPNYAAGLPKNAISGRSVTNGREKNGTTLAGDSDEVFAEIQRSLSKIGQGPL
jgi:hypothetical protein